MWHLLSPSSHLRLIISNISSLPLCLHFCPSLPARLSCHPHPSYSHPSQGRQSKGLIYQTPEKTICLCMYVY
ncbi:hypothetical protein XENTR_v10004504 [Xenopus tropicalis]|nr:hypothetical protein XENTR_v10004504 [Xenopus tropicalis]